MDLSLRYIFRYLFLKSLPPFFYKFILQIKIKKLYNRKLELNSPERLSDKIQWIKLYGDHNNKRFLCDKLYAKDFVAKKIPELKFAKVYQQGNSFKDINIEKLPACFILKTNHAWQTNTFVPDKNVLTKEDLKDYYQHYKKLLNINYAYWSYYELQYKDIKPQIYAEELLGEYEKISYYEAWCFNGKVEFVSYRFLRKVSDTELESQQYFFSPKWEPLDFYINFKGKEKPKSGINKEKVIKYAEILSQGIDFVRVDFMEINNELYFGEMTFTPCSGFFQFVPDEYDFIYGRKLILDKQ